MPRRPGDSGNGDRSNRGDLSSSSHLDTCVNDYDECGDLLSLPETDSNSIMLITSPPSIMHETDSGILILEDGGPDVAISEEKQSQEDDDDDLRQEWNASFYVLQAHAPKAVRIATSKPMETSPPHFGLEYHGYLYPQEADFLLGTADGAYLVRDSVDGERILSMRMNGIMYDYRLFYEDGQHYVGENRFDDIEDLVQDGLVTLYLQCHEVAPTVHEECMTQHRKAEKRPPMLQRSHGKRVRGLKGKKAWEYQGRISTTSLSSARSPSPTPSPQSQSPMLSPKMISSYQIKGESNLDRMSTEIRRSTPNLSTCTLLGQESSIKRPASAQLSDCSSPTNHRYSAIVSTLRDALINDKKIEQLRLDKTNMRLKPCSSDGRIGMSTIFNERKKVLKDNGVRASRTLSCHFPYMATLDRVADISLKGTNSLSRSSMTALARHTSGPSSPYFKAHNFITHTYKSPTWCELCHHFLWGLTNQGLRCKDCGMDIHKLCIPTAVLLECYPNKQCVKQVYGVDLTTLLKLEGNLVPNILNECVNELQSRDLSSEGIYRLSGQTSEILCLKEKYDDGEKIDLTQYMDISVLTGAIKLYLRELPIPLVTFDTYHEIIRVAAKIEDADEPDENWSCLIEVLKLLPKAHYNTLKFIIQHLYRIQLKSSENKMTAQNLSVIFAPTLMKSAGEDCDLIKDLPIQKNLIEYLILKQELIFA